MVKRVLVLFLLISCLTKAQEVVCTQISKIPLVADRFIGIDDFNYMYYVDDDVFYKKGTETCILYNNLQLGSIGTVDILNPLEITLFYPDFNTVVKLDNTLNEIIKLDFTTLKHFRNIQYTTTANDKNLWIFNSDLQQLEILNYQTQEIISINQPLTEEVIAQKSNYNFCWLLSKKALLKYNIYGSLLSTTPLENYDALSQSKNHLVLRKGNTLFYKKDGVSQPVLLNILDIPIKDFYINANNLYLYDGKNIHHYQLSFQ